MSSIWKKFIFKNDIYAVAIAADYTVEIPLLRWCNELPDMSSTPAIVFKMQGTGDTLIILDPESCPPLTSSFNYQLLWGAGGNTYTTFRYMCYTGLGKTGKEQNIGEAAL